ncbi:hypothetical protein G7008_16395 [Pseudomonas psychrotolerans]|uniref:hypothetical protein n=1 Tax=Pseudomonas oryzihabitans TaxID=47885 RepID=UPI0011109AB2|nr:hypothetical protein [Pseudomonas psychrotolerans]MBA1182089.1 hypothetical protein [Pseudomonas psychrotolerans]MBA1211443.1 hypothetical protein [Pseudomonas psychrotolerans]
MNGFPGDVVYEVRYDGGLQAHGSFEIQLTHHEDYSHRGTLLPILIADQILNQHSGIYVALGENLYPSPPLCNEPPTIHPMSVEIRQKGTDRWTAIESDKGPWGFTLDEELVRLPLVEERFRSVTPGPDD